MTTEDNLTTRLIRVKDLPKVAALHQRAFADSALSKLGSEPLRRYYEWQLTGPHDCYAIGIFDNANSLLGFCFSGVFHGSLSGFLNKNRNFLVFWMFAHPWLINNQIVMDRIKIALNIFRKKPSKKQPIKQEQTRSFGVLSIAVDPERQGLGIGKIIMESVEMEALMKGFTQMNLTVHPSNHGAIAFYENLGWIKVNNESDNWTGSMIKPLSPHYG